MGAIFDVIDGCDRALGAHADDSAMQEGLMMLLEQSLAAAAAANLHSVHPDGETFDPHQHEAIAQAPGGIAGQVAQVVRRGWLLGPRLVRAAQVVVHDGVGCPHGREDATQCLRCFREQRGDSELRRRSRP